MLYSMLTFGQTHMLYSMLTIGRIRHARSLEPQIWLRCQLALSARGEARAKDVLDLGLPPMS